MTGYCLLPGQGIWRAGGDIWRFWPPSHT